MILSVIQSDSRFLSGTDSTSYSDTNLNRNLNSAYHDMINEIINSMSDWDVQFETAIADLVADQREYCFPSDILTIKKVQLKLDGTNWREASKFDVTQSAVAISSETDILNNFSNDEPYVDLGDNSFFIYSDTITAVSSGIKIWYTKEITELSSASDEPVIAEAYHKGLSYAAARDYFYSIKMIDKAKEMDDKYKETVKKMTVFYSNKSKDMPIRPTSATGDLEEYE